MSDNKDETITALKHEIEELKNQIANLNKAVRELQSGQAELLVRLRRA